MTVVTDQNGTNIALLNVVTPFSQLDAGAGRAARLKVVEDVLSLPTTFFSATANWGRLCRIPSNAKIKRVEVATDVAIDAHATASTAAFKIGMVFSNSTNDGTPSSYQNLQPTTVGIGGGTTTPGTTVAINGSNANFLFGTVTAPAVSAAIPLTDVTLKGVGATYGTALQITEQALVGLFNFRNAQKQVIPNLGYMDFLILSSAVYATVPGAAANLFLRCTYAE